MYIISALFGYNNVCTVISCFFPIPTFHNLAYRQALRKQLRLGYFWIPLSTSTAIQIPFNCSIRIKIDKVRTLEPFIAHTQHIRKINI